MLRSSAIYSGLTMVSRFMGFLRDLVKSYRLGASAAGDAYETMLAFPNLFRRIFAEGAFATAFVPAYARSLHDDGEEVADVLAADAMATLAAATIVVTLVCCLAMPWLMMLINPGYAKDPAKYKLAVTLTQISMPYLPCMAIYAHLSGVLQARGRFIFSAFAPTLMNIIMLIAMWPQTQAVAAAYAASFGVVVAGVAQAALLWWGVNRSGARVDFRWPRLTPEIKALIMLSLPGSLAASVTQINLFISGFLASFVPGARVWLSNADRLYQLPLGLVGVAIGVALLPRLSTTIHRGDERGAQAAMDESLALSLAFALPAAAALSAMPFFLIDGLVVRGRFHVVDAQATASALFWYGLGTPAFVLQRILTQAFFARQDTRSPMRFALVSVAVNITAGVVLFNTLHRWGGGAGQGVQGLAIATSLASWVSIAQMVWALRERGWYRMSAPTVRRIARILLASLIMAAVLAAMSHFRGLYEPLLFHRKELALALAVALGAGVYVVLLPLLHAVTPAEVRAALRRGPRAAAAAAPES
ncbi:MAG: murein biosynthesis integral membrane protein MurJ [Caulobacteraceae bacterium]|nr:murein biosynthesis integral membrane protein MurJ [Caulobacter sp.]